MRTLVHLSDLHFGRVDPALLAPLTARIERIAPDLVVVSGDLTQRARSDEFIAARAFLDSLRLPLVVVPGNHDIPLHNLYDRFLRPLHKYRRYITADLQPFYTDGEIAVVGINTARSMTIKDGRINVLQMKQVSASFAGLPAEVIRIIVSHHPFDLPDQFLRSDLAGRADPAMQIFADCGADLLLAGHLHASHAGTTAAHHAIDGFAALVVQAGTATSTRGRGEENSFNVLRVASTEITAERYTWSAPADTFELSNTERFIRRGAQWIRQAADPSD
ncbi:MAG: metallophosphoesterase [Herminiimonas sp.]|nr:metallophosphoesterase [Herminiimonas sp.]